MEQYILAKLRKMYPDRRITNIYKDHPLEYSYLREAALKNRLSISEFLKNNGFIYVKEKTGSGSKNFDSETAKLLIDQYQFSGADLAKIFRVTRAEISRKIVNKITNTDWQDNRLLPHEIETIKKMVLTDRFEYGKNNLYIRIANDGENICVFIKKGLAVKTVFRLPESLDAFLRKHHYHLLGPQDMEIKKDLIPVKVMGKTYAAYGTPNLSSKVSNRCTRLGLSRDEYLQLHGFHGFCRNGKDTDEDIIRILRKYSDGNNRVYFPNRGPHKPPEYNVIANRASREQMSMDEFFQFFGFTKIKGRHRTTYYKKSEEFKKELAEHRIGDTDNVYIKANTGLYRRIYSFCKLRNMSVDDMLAEWGFNRVRKHSIHTK
jgi:hypothetical protein